MVVRKTLLFLALFQAMAFSAFAQETSKVAIFLSENEEEYVGTAAAFRAEMGEGVGIYTFSLAGLKLGDAKMDLFVKQARAVKPQLFFAVGQKAFYLLMYERTIPVIYAGIPDYISDAIRKKHQSDSLKNINGVYWGDRRCALESLKAFHELLPGARRVGVIYSEYHSELIRELKKQADNLGLQIFASKIRNTTEAVPTIDDLVTKVDAFLVLKRDRLGSRGDVRERLLEIATAQKSIPVITTHPADLKRGALALVDLDGSRSGREAASLLKSLQKNGFQKSPVLLEAKDLSFERKFNVRTARGLRVSLPTSTKWEMVE